MIVLDDALNFLSTPRDYAYVVLSPSDFGQLVYNGQTVEASKEGVVQYKAFLNELVAKLNPTGGFVSCIVTDRKYKGQILSRSTMMVNAFEEAGWKIHTKKIWAHTLKANLYRTTYTDVITFCKGKYSANLVPGIRPDVWLVEEDADYKDETAKHHGVIPREILIRLIASYSKVGDIVLDPFAGTASTSEVSIQLNRKYLAVEIDPEMFAIAHERLNQTIIT